MKTRMHIPALSSPVKKLRGPLRDITIRRKLLIGAGLIILSILIISFSAILQLHQLTRLMSTAVAVDAAILGDADTLRDVFLSQTAAERKFAITGDADFRQIFNDNAGEFRDILNEMQAAARDPAIRVHLSRIGTLYAGYLGSAAAALSRAGQISGQDARAIKKAEGDVTAAIESLSGAVRKVLKSKIAGSQEISSGGARRIGLIAAITALAALCFAVLIARSIYQPLRSLKEATQRIACGDFSKKIDISRRDELGDLSVAFNGMCDRLRELERLKSEFISGISHDLKTPLASITEANQLMLDGAAGDITPQQRRLLDIISQDSARLMRLISSIIDLARMESGILSYDLRQADICLLAREAVESVRFLACSKQLSIALEPAEGLPRIPLDCDKLRQALINLLSNAIKFTPAGGSITLAITHAAADHASGSGAVMISIADTGIGINSADLPRIFDKFYRGGPASGNGSGLGLTIARYIVQAHGGTIRVESAPGAGSTFQVVLPAGPAPESPAAHA